MSKNNKQAKGVLDVFLQATDEFIDGLNQFSDRLSTKGNLFHLKDAIGKDAEVSVSIPADGMGEVIVSMGRGLQNYPAKCMKSKHTYKRGAKVRIVDVANATMLVEPCVDQK